jgi:glycosyltransferase involved in cell wall biosynthesis
MKFACVHHGDQHSEQLWSAIPLNIIRALSALGHEVVTVDGLRPQAPFFSKVKRSLYRRILKKVYWINRDPLVLRCRAKEANRRLRDLAGIDAVLITFPADLAYLETDHPVLVVHDATWVQLLDYYPRFMRNETAAETIRDGMELDKRALQRCDHVVYSSQWAADSAVRDYGVPPDKVSVAPLGASIVNEPTRDDLARYLSLRGQEPMKLLFVGKEWHRKGGDFAMEVGSEIEAMGIPVELHVVGCNPDEELARFVRQHGLLRKDVPREAEELRALYESCDYFILPTRAEAFGIVFAEAAAFGLPVMAMETGGVKDAVRGEWGITLPPESSPTAYAQWAVERYRNRVEYERLSWLARRSFEEELNWAAFCRHLAQKAAECARLRRL